jgi:hypothetical protein
VSRPTLLGERPPATLTAAALSTLPDRLSCLVPYPEGAALGYQWGDVLAPRWGRGVVWVSVYVLWPASHVRAAVAQLRAVRGGA